MSTSLKVVSIAAVFCASFSRAATILRSRVIRTRSSRAPAGAERRAGTGDGVGQAAGSRGGQKRRRRRPPAQVAGSARSPPGAGPLPWLATKSSTSPLVSRPSLPEAGIFAGSRRCLLDQLAHGRRQQRTTFAVGPDGGADAGGGCEPGAAGAGIGAGFASAPAAAPDAGFGLAARACRLADRARARRRPRRRYRPRRRRSRRAAGDRRRNLDGHLVGLQLDQRLVDGDRVARRLHPLGDGRLADRLAERRDLDFRRHRLASSRAARHAARQRATRRNGCGSESTVAHQRPLDQQPLFLLRAPSAARSPARPPPRGRRRPAGRRRAPALPGCCASRGNTKVQAPMFAGSSWHHTTSALG